MNAAEITTKRLLCGRHRLIRDGKVVGEVWRFRGRRDFGMQLNGVYWHNGKPNTRGGQAALRTRRLMDAVAIAADYFKTAP